jgi:hypothetical protein
MVQNAFHAFTLWDISSAHGAHIKSNSSILDPILIREIRR